MFKIRTNLDILVFAISFSIIAVVFIGASIFIRFGTTLDREIVKFALANTIGLTFMLSTYAAWVFKRQIDVLQMLKEMVETDMLTGTSSREHFFRSIVNDPAATGVIVMCDIDHFKAVNDTHGHLAGDEVLREVGTVLMRMTRADDMVCRFGGEEFVIFLRDVPVFVAHEMAERIRVRLAESSIRVEGAAIRVTASFGISVAAPGVPLDQALRLADIALYEAKLMGRNRVVSSNPTSSPLWRQVTERLSDVT